MELDPNLTMESVQWLLSENVKAGTLALFWCLKSQFVKVKARAFFRWQQKILLGKFLSPIKHSTNIGQNNGGTGQQNFQNNHNRHPGDHTEHIVTDTIHRSERKLLLSLKRDYLRHEKDQKNPQSPRYRKNSDDNGYFNAPISNGSSQRRQLPAQEQQQQLQTIPRYMQGTTAASAKYSTSAVYDSQVITRITRSSRSVSPVKEAAQRRLSNSTSKLASVDRYQPMTSNKRPASADQRSRSLSRPRPPPPSPSRRYYEDSPDEFHIHSQAFSTVKQDPNTVHQQHHTPHQQSAIRSIESTDSVTQTELKAFSPELIIETTTKNELLASLNDRFKSLAAKGFLDEETVKSVFSNNAMIVDDFWKNTHAIPSMFSSSLSHPNTVAAKVEADPSKENTYMRDRGLNTDVRYSARKPTYHSDHELSADEEENYRQPRARTPHQGEAYTPRDYLRSSGSRPFENDGFYRGRSSQLASTASSRGRSVERRPSSQKKAAWGAGAGASSSRSPSKTRVDTAVSATPTSGVDRAQLNLLQPRLNDRNSADSSKPWYASLRA